MPDEHDRVVLTEPVPHEGLVEGDVGTVVHVYPDGQAYEVEFTTLTGLPVAVVTVPSAGVRHLTENEIAHARRITRAV